MENLQIQNYKDYINNSIGDWNIIDSDDIGQSYAIVLQKENLQRIFFIRKPVIKAASLGLSNDVYEIWYKDFQDSKLLTLSEVLDINIVLSKIEELLEKYSKYE